MVNLDKWQALYQEVNTLKSCLPADTQIKQRGFSIFFAPPRIGRLLLVGLNPSRSDSSYITKYPAAEQSFPAEHLYIGERGGKLGRELLSMLADGSIDHADPSEIDAWQEIIKGTKINIFFFGSRNWTEWNNKSFWGSGGHALRRKVEIKCKEWTRHAIAMIAPSRILCEGFAAFDQLCEMFELIPGKERIVTRPGRGNQRLFAKTLIRIDGVSTPILGILHPTGGRGRSKEESVALGRAIIEFCTDT